VNEDGETEIQVVLEGARASCAAARKNIESIVDDVVCLHSFYFYDLGIT
jgi:hypothetical protein